MKFSIFQETRQGGRKYNQDRMGYVFSRDALLLLLADGMGGHAHGEIAAQITVECLGRKFQREAKTWLADPMKFLQEGIDEAHAAIIRHADEKGMLETPRTTVVAAVIQNGSACWAHVGDSRVYLLRRGQVEAVTRDHSRVQQLVLQGLVREEAVAAHPDRNKIYNCIGAHIPPQIELSPRHRLQTGDVLLLCSDGLWGPLPARLLATAFLNDPLAQSVPALMTQAESRAGKDADNITALAMTWDETESAAGSVSTHTLPPGEFNSQIDPPDGAERFLSDDEIDNAVDEIRQALAKSSRPGP